MNGDIETVVNNIKKKQEKNIIIFRSPPAIHALLHKKLVDEFYLFVNPVLLGDGISLFKSIEERQQLKLQSGRIFNGCTVICLHYCR